jgi:hypothetical protein
MLTKCVSRTDGCVLELGCGAYSTPILHELLADAGRSLLSVDSDREWMVQFEDLRCEWHRLECVGMTDHFRKTGQPLSTDFEVWAQCPMIDAHDWAVVLVDHRPGERRKDDILRLRNRARYIVVHDTEAACYGYEPILSKFKYRFDYKRETAAWTTVVSDLAKLW